MKCRLVTQWVSNERRTICQQGDCAAAGMEEEDDELVGYRGHNGYK